MSVLSHPTVASLAARAMQRLVLAGQGRSKRHSPLDRFPDVPRNAFELVIPTSIAPAKAVVYLPATPAETPPPVHVNFHGGGYVMPLLDGDDPLCRFLAADAGVVVINVDYVLAPQHPFPAAPRQAFEVVRWAASHGDQHGWDGAHLTVGGQSAGGGLAAAVARQALEEGGPALALQVLHYPPLDLATSAKDKRAAIARPVLRPWMAEIFDNAYVPDGRDRFDRLVSPANPADTADLRGIAPALVITTAFDLLRAEGSLYADRLRGAGALVEYHDVSDADHGYDAEDDAKARAVYSLIARHICRATTAEAPKAP